MHCMLRSHSLIFLGIFFLVVVVCLQSDFFKSTGKDGFGFELGVASGWQTQVNSQGWSKTYSQGRKWKAASTGALVSGSRVLEWDQLSHSWVSRAPPWRSPSSYAVDLLVLRPRPAEMRVYCSMSCDSDTSEGKQVPMGCWEQEPRLGSSVMLGSEKCTDIQSQGHTYR